MQGSFLAKRILEEELSYLRCNEPFLARLAHKGPKCLFTKQLITRQDEQSTKQARIVVPRDPNSNLRLAYFNFLQECHQNRKPQSSILLLKFKMALYNLQFTLDGFDITNLPVEFRHLYSNLNFRKVLLEFFYMLDTTDLYATLSAYPIIDVVMVVAIRKLLGELGTGRWQPISNAQIVQYFCELGFSAKEITPDIIYFEKNQTMIRQDRNYSYLDHLKINEERYPLSKHNSQSKLNYITFKTEQAAQSASEALKKSPSEVLSLTSSNNKSSSPSSSTAQPIQINFSSKISAPEVIISKIDSVPSTAVAPEARNEDFDDQNQKESIYNRLDGLASVKGSTFSSQIIDFDNPEAKPKPIREINNYPAITIQHPQFQQTPNRNNSSKLLLLTRSESPKSPQLPSTVIRNPQVFLKFQNKQSRNHIFHHPSYNQTPKTQKLSPVQDKRLSLNQRSKIIIQTPKNIVMPKNNASQLRVQVGSPTTVKLYSPKGNLNFVHRGPERLSDKSMFNNSGVIYYPKGRRV